MHVPGVHAHARGVLGELAGRGLADLLVRLQRLVARARAEQPVGQVERRREGEVGVLPLVQTRLVARFRQALLLFHASARALKRASRVTRDSQPRGRLEQHMHLGLHLAAPLVGAVVRAARQRRRRGLRATARAPGAVPRRLCGRCARSRAPTGHRGRERPRGYLGLGRRRRAARAGVAVIELIVIAASGLGTWSAGTRVGGDGEVPGRSARAHCAYTRARGGDAGTRGRSGASRRAGRVVEAGISETGNGTGNGDASRRYAGARAATWAMAGGTSSARGCDSTYIRGRRPGDPSVEVIVVLHRVRVSAASSVVVSGKRKRSTSTAGHPVEVFRDKLLDFLGICREGCLEY